MREYALLIMLALTGCSAMSYNMGMRAGIKEYHKMKSTGIVRKSYGVGYASGFTHAKALDDLMDSAKRLKKAIMDMEKDEPTRKMNSDHMRGVGKDVDQMLMDELLDADHKVIQKP